MYRAMKASVIVNSFSKLAELQLPKGVELQMSGPQIYVKADVNILHYINEDRIIQDVHKILKENHCNRWKEPDEGCTCAAPADFGTQSCVYVKQDDRAKNIWSIHKLSQELVQTQKSYEDIKAFLQ